MKKVWIYLGLVWVLSWPFWFLSGVLGRGEPLVRDLHWWVAQIGVCAPSIAAVILSAFSSRALRANAIRLLLFYAFVLGAGLFIAFEKPAAGSEYSPFVSIVTLIVAPAALLFLSPWNTLLLMPGTGVPQTGGNGKWILLATLGAPCMFLLCWFVAGTAGYALSISTMKNGLPGFLTVLLLSFCMNLAYGGSLGEELGWRGYCLPLLLKKYNPVRASVFLGVVGAFWHLPIDITNGDVSAPAMIIFRLMWALPWTIIFTWLYLSSGAKLLTAVLLHTSVNILPDLGFSHYQQTILLLTVFVIGAAVAVTRTPVMKQWKSETEGVQ